MLYPATAGKGLSPRGRGKPLPYGHWRSGSRSIPAWAGETQSVLRPVRRPRVYPRVGGGNDLVIDRILFATGLSPRGRGKQSRQVIVQPFQGSIPAWAGETSFSLARSQTGTVYPRVGGGNDGPIQFQPYRVGLSPRGRGKPPGAPYSVTLTGSIPAWAGETQWSRYGRWQKRVYPRVGGGNPAAAIVSPFGLGLSPRGRGKLGIAEQPLGLPQSIPAWAGETVKG